MVFYMNLWWWFIALFIMVNLLLFMWNIKVTLIISWSLRLFSVMSYCIETMDQDENIHKYVNKITK